MKIKYTFLFFILVCLFLVFLNFSYGKKDDNYSVLMSYDNSQNIIALFECTDFFVEPVVDISNKEISKNSSLFLDDSNDKLLKIYVYDFFKVKNYVMDNHYLKNPYLILKSEDYFYKYLVYFIGAVNKENLNCVDENGYLTVTPKRIIYNMNLTVNEDEKFLSLISEYDDESYLVISAIRVF